MDRKQTAIRKSSMHQQFVWRCRLDLFSRLLDGDLWKLIGGERREARRLSPHEKKTGKKGPPKIATTLMKFSIGKLQRTAFARISPNVFTLTCIRAERTLPT